MSSGVRVKLDLSIFLSGPDRYRWIYLSYDKFQHIGDINTYLSKEYQVERSNIQLFLEEPFSLPNEEDIKLLQSGDLIKVTLKKVQAERKESIREAVPARQCVKFTSDTEGLLPSEEIVSQKQVEREEMNKQLFASERQGVKSTSDDAGVLLQPKEIVSKKRRKRKRATPKKKGERDEDSCLKVVGDRPPEVSQILQVHEPVSPPIKSKKKRSLDQPAETNHSCLPSSQCETISCENALLGKRDRPNNFSSLLQLASGTAFSRKVKKVESLHNGDEERKYSELPTIDELPQIGQKVAFRMLELDAEYSPVLSAFKEGLVLSVNDGQVALQLQKGSEIRRDEGKFAIEESCFGLEEDRFMSVEWSNVKVAKLLK